MAISAGVQVDILTAFIAWHLKSQHSPTQHSSDGQRGAKTRCAYYCLMAASVIAAYRLDVSNWLVRHHLTISGLRWAPHVAARVNIPHRDMTSWKRNTLENPANYLCDG
ncbi:hypothetical protein E2C01_098377 [Portunus trituberculatus]|uniref:Uncharacterized protein n=1 Tax=Portunus trituberculatus TaxID=210409 RepID=A0A5B7K2U5_PORTR|nr:hypothetical protein [Portunus trituberculatus]